MNIIYNYIFSTCWLLFCFWKEAPGADASRKLLHVREVAGAGSRPWRHLPIDVRRIPAPRQLRADHVTRPPGPTPGASVDRHGHLHLRRRTLPDRRPRPDGLSRSDDVRLHGRPTRPDAVPETTGSQWNDHRLRDLQPAEGSDIRIAVPDGGDDQVGSGEGVFRIGFRSAPSYRMITTKNEEQVRVGRTNAEHRRTFCLCVYIIHIRRTQTLHLYIWREYIIENQKCGHVFISSMKPVVDGITNRFSVYQDKIERIRTKFWPCDSPHSFLFPPSQHPRLVNFIPATLTEIHKLISASESKP